MNRSYSLEAVIIKRYVFGEADRLLTIFSNRQGKISVVAKGTRRIHSRKAPHMELFKRVQLFIARTRSLDIITEAATIESYQHLRGQLERIAYAYRLVEIIDRLCPEREPHPVIYDSLISTLRMLNLQDQIPPDKTVDQFTLLLLWELGYLPRTTQLTGEKLHEFLITVMEKTLTSDRFLTKIY
jgi:DNA repair protein RecO (recombination protein O)